MKVAELPADGREIPALDNCPARGPIAQSLCESRSTARVHGTGPHAGCSRMLVRKGPGSGTSRSPRARRLACPASPGRCATSSLSDSGLDPRANVQWPEFPSICGERFTSGETQRKPGSPNGRPIEMPSKSPRISVAIAPIDVQCARRASAVRGCRELAYHEVN